MDSLAQINDLDSERLPPDLILDPHHPANDDYLTNLEHLKKRIVAQTRLMYPTHVEIVKLRHRARKYKDIAARVGVTEPTVARTLKRPDARRLLSLLTYLSLAIDGANDAQRRHMLWRIACDNEVDDARVSISALAEINKMTHQGRVLEAGLQGGEKIEITINNAVLPRGELDK